MSLKKIYLDNNATTAMDPRVLEAVVRDLQETVGNPSSIHSFGQQARQKLTKARQIIATNLGVKPQEIVFTSGGSEGANYILRGLFTPQSPGHIITSSVEHSCIYKTVQYLETLGSPATFLSPGALGAITPEAVQQALKHSTKLIALTAVNNETGVKTDVEAIAALAVQAKVPFLVDGVALLGKESFIIPQGVSAMIFSGHKVHAPKGIGFVFVRSSLKLQPLLIGGEQEFGRRAGSENLSGIAGLAEAVRLLKEEVPKAQERMEALRYHLENSLLARLPNVKINGLGTRICNTSNLCFFGVEGETLLTALDLAGIAVSHGSACASGALEPSRVLINMGISPSEAASSLRFSLSRQTTKDEIDHCIEIVVSLVNRMRV
ncbi:MAG: cysteine desulfurase [Parachlamydiaceae bacterium]|nr:cysteine desulfurase [Parachlamydiaceae bacterium]